MNLSVVSGYGYARKILRLFGRMAKGLLIFLLIENANRQENEMLWSKPNPIVVNFDQFNMTKFLEQTKIMWTKFPFNRKLLALSLCLYFIVETNYQKNKNVSNTLCITKCTNFLDNPCLNDVQRLWSGLQGAKVSQNCPPPKVSADVGFCLTPCWSPLIF